MAPKADLGQVVESHGGNSNAYQWVKEDNLERLHAVWFKLCDILENAKKMETVKTTVVAKD